MSKEIEEIQKIIQKGCADGKPYPWCSLNDSCEGRACWYHEAEAVYEAGYHKLPDRKCQHLVAEKTGICLHCGKEIITPKGEPPLVDDEDTYPSVLAEDYGSGGNSEE